MDADLIKVLEFQNPWWFDKDFFIGIDRLKNYKNIMKYLETKEILFLIGVRRTGKSTLMFQLINYLLNKKINPKKILFLNLDDPYFQSKKDNAKLITSIVEQYFIYNNIEKLYLFIDEIQNYNYWSDSLKIIYDTFSNVKIIASGSSSNIIESKLSVKVSGRYFYEIIYPLSFKEYLYFNNKKNLKLLEYKKEFEFFLKFGGFPRVVLEKDVDLKNEILKNYFQTIYLKDIILPNNLRNNQDVYNLLYYLITNSGTYFSYNTLSKILNISVDTVKEYIDYSLKTYLISSLSKFEYSLKKQLMSPKKIYAVDTGLINSVSFKFSENYGRLLENLVFIELKRREKEIYYHKNKKECDFVVKEHNNIVEAIQVTKSLEDLETKKREYEGLIDAMRTYNLKEGLILTEDEEFEEVINDKKSGKKFKVKVMPIWKWVLS